MHRKLNIIGILALMAGVIFYGAGARQAVAAPAAQAGAQNWTVLNGAQAFTEPGEKATWQMMKFYPATITINAGDTVTWKHNSGPEPHTTTFLAGEPRPDEIIPEGPPPAGAPPTLIGNPKVFFPAGGTTYDGTAFTGSGVMADILPGPKEYKLTFPKEGTYEYICNLHAFQLPDGTLVGMKGTVVVQAAGAAAPKTTAQVNADATAQIEADRQAAATKQPQITSMVKPSVQQANGSMTHYVNVGYFDEMTSMEYQRFWPKEININQGDTVEWSMPTGGFHTVTFGEEPDIFIIQPQTSGPPKVMLNPLFFPAGSNTHTGTGYYNSGPLAGPDDPPDAGPKSYSLTFSQPGRYEYICIPHYTQGMDATVIVKAATGGATPPTTGGADQPGMPTTGNGSGWTLYALVAGLVLTLAGVVLRRRKVNVIE
jgi:LPXTG-motif cell wall-anchored protein